MRHSTVNWGSCMMTVLGYQRSRPSSSAGTRSAVLSVAAVLLSFLAGCGIPTDHTSDKVAAQARQVQEHFSAKLRTAVASQLGQVRTTEQARTLGMSLAATSKVPGRSQLDVLGHTVIIADAVIEANRERGINLADDKLAEVLAPLLALMTQTLGEVARPVSQARGRDGAVALLTLNGTLERLTVFRRGLRRFEDSSLREQIRKLDSKVFALYVFLQAQGRKAGH